MQPSLCPHVRITLGWLELHDDDNRLTKTSRWW